MTWLEHQEYLVLCTGMQHIWLAPFIYIMPLLEMLIILCLYKTFYLLVFLLIFYFEVATVQILRLKVKKTSGYILFLILCKNSKLSFQNNYWVQYINMKCALIFISPLNVWMILYIFDCLYICVWNAPQLLYDSFVVTKCFCVKCLLVC